MAWQADTRVVYLDEEILQRDLDRVLIGAADVVDERRVVHLLRQVADDVDVLRRRGSQDREYLLGDRDRLDAIKYTFVTAVKGCIRTGQHIAASEGWKPPATNAETFHVIGSHGVIDRTIAGRMASAAGFRNLLIHQYADIDDVRVVTCLDSLDDLTRFVDQVSAWLDSEAGYLRSWQPRPSLP